MVANKGNAEGIKNIPVKTKISPIVVKTCILFIAIQIYKFYLIKNNDVARIQGFLIKKFGAAHRNNI